MSDLEDFIITEAKYFTFDGEEDKHIKVRLDDSPLWTFFKQDDESRLYRQIKSEVAAGTLTIADEE